MYEWSSVFQTGCCRIGVCMCMQLYLSVGWKAWAATLQIERYTNYMAWQYYAIKGMNLEMFGMGRWYLRHGTQLVLQ